jgi:arylsulfatase A-like enzyme
MFLWVHLFEPHSPYERHDGLPDKVDHKAILAQEPGYSYSPEEIAGLKEQYRMEVEYVDTQVKVLLDGLKAAGKLENAVVMLVGDHGESLGEHDIHFNHHGLYENVLRVPMILWTPQPAWAAGQRIAGQASVLDVANTLLSAAGLPLLSGTHSEALTARAMGAEIKPEGALLMGREGISLSEGMLYGVRSSNGVKYIQHPDGTEEFYDLNADPGETTNLAGDQVKGVLLGRQNVEALKNLGPGNHSSVDPTTKAMLESLGYLQ